MDSLDLGLLVRRLNRKMWHLDIDDIEMFIEGFDNLFYHENNHLTRSRMNIKKLWDIEPEDVDKNNVWDFILMLKEKKLVNRSLLKSFWNSFYEDIPRKNIFGKIKKAKDGTVKTKKKKVKKNELKDYPLFIEGFQDFIRTLIKFDSYCLYLDIFNKKRPETALRTVVKTNLLLKGMRESVYYEPLFGEFWRKSENIIIPVDQDIVEDHLTVLEQGEFFLKLSELIARMDESVKNVEDYIVWERHIKKNIIDVKKIPENTIGMTFGDNLQIALPHQLAMRHHKMMKKVFGVSLLEKRLMILEQSGKAMVPEVRRVPVIKFRNLQKGPVVIIIDTSKSMRGMPESIAKAISIAVTNVTAGQKRKCFIIGFNDKNKGIDATPLGEGFVSLQKMFINEFENVTSIEKTLEMSVEKLTESDYRNSDVLLISDKIVEEISEELLERIAKAKRELVRFHSIHVDYERNKGRVHETFDHEVSSNAIWDNIWSYNGDAQCGARLLEKIQSSFYNTVEKNLQEMEEIRANKVIEEGKRTMRHSVISIPTRSVK